ncbi:MAG: hypothetical protein ACO1RX_22340 [Candidatus Sericytochromatia bacterium]
MHEPFVCLILGAGPDVRNSLGIPQHPLLRPFLNRNALWYVLRKLQQSGMKRMLLLCDEQALGLSCAQLRRQLNDLAHPPELISSSSSLYWRAALLEQLSDEAPVLLAQQPTLDQIDWEALLTFHTTQQADCTLRLSQQSGWQSLPLILGPDAQLQPQPSSGSQLVYSTRSCLIEPDMLEALLTDGLDLVTAPLIPALLQTAEYLSGYLSSSPWNEWRSLDALLRAESAWLQSEPACGQLHTLKGAQIWADPGARWDHTVRFSGTVLLGADVQIGPGAHLQGPLVIGANSQIGAQTQLCQSSLGAGCSVGPHSRLRHSWLGTGVKLSAHQDLRHVQIGDHSQLSGARSLPAGTRLGAETRL